MSNRNISDNQNPASEDDSPVNIFIASSGAQLTLVIIVCVIACAIVVAAVQQYFISHESLSPVALAGLPLLCTVLLMIKISRLKLAFVIFIWGIALMGAANAFIVSGLQTPALLALPVVSMLAAWLLGRLQGVLILCFNIVMLIIITIAQVAGQLPAQARSPIIWAFVYVAVCMIGTVFGLVMTASTREHFRRANQLSKELEQINAELEVKVANRTAELSDALIHLKQTQDDLIQSEKLASLGSLVAGISHELNTPLGNALLMSTSLLNNFKHLNETMQQGSMKRSELLHWIGGASEMVQLCDRSIGRAATLVASFKAVAIDQTSEQRRIFDLHKTVEDILTTLRPGFGNAPWVISNDIPSGIECDGFPGPFGQVITNLIQNAALHGFEGRTEGKITISARSENGMVDLSVTDDGIGMNSATLVHIFDPFFTTKLGKGGSGLGLAICYRITSTILAGEIRAISSPGCGAQFTLSMPQRTPGIL